jgi:hypothetical protein
MDDKGFEMIEVRFIKDCQGELVEPVALNKTRLRQAQAYYLLIYGLNCFINMFYQRNNDCQYN